MIAKPASGHDHESIQISFISCSLIGVFSSEKFEAAFLVSIILNNVNKKLLVQTDTGVKGIDRFFLIPKTSVCNHTVVLI